MEVDARFLDAESSVAGLERSKNNRLGWGRSGQLFSFTISRVEVNARFLDTESGLEGSERPKNSRLGRVSAGFLRCHAPGRSQIGFNLLCFFLLLHFNISGLSQYCFAKIERLSISAQV